MVWCCRLSSRVIYICQVPADSLSSALVSHCWKYPRRSGQFAPAAWQGVWGLSLNSLKAGNWQRAKWVPPSMSKREDFHVYSSTTHHRHRNHAAVWETPSIACLWTWLIWGFMAHRKWKLIYASVKDAQDCKKDVSNGYQYKRSMHWKHDERQCKTEVTNTLRIRLSS